MTSEADDEAAAKVAIRELLERWVLSRDNGRFEDLAAIFHSDAIMNTTWQQSSASEFVTASRVAWERGLDVLHQLGGGTITVRGNGAVAESKMTISQRADLDAVLVDVTCIGRFFDLLERRDGKWGIVNRQPIYDRDRIDPVDPNATVALDPDLLARFPCGYRHLGYLQTKLGLNVKTDMPGRTGEAVEMLYLAGKRWLEQPLYGMYS